MQDNLEKIIANALAVDKYKLKNSVKEIVALILKAIISNKDAILQANSIDKKNNNGFELDFDVVNNIFANLEREKLFYGDVTLSQKDDDKNIIYGTEIMDIGNVVVITDGNPYVLIEMAVRNLMAGNTTIFANRGYMYGTNNLLVSIMQSALEQLNISQYFVQLFVTEEYDKLLSNFANIDKIICIGNRELQNEITKKSKNEIFVSGYENFDLYIEDETHADFIDKIMNTGLNVQVYIEDDLDLDYPNAMFVTDVDEAIGQINYNGSRYSASIFTTSTENASKFINEVKSKIVTMNTSPTIERIIDIKQRNLINEKTIIYPVNFKFDGKITNIKIS